MLLNGGPINAGVINGSVSGEVLVDAEPPGVARYSCLLTGAQNGTTDLALKISSFQGRLKNNKPSYLSVVIPGASSLATAITLRKDGQLVVTRHLIRPDGTEIDAQEIARVDLETIRTDLGARSNSASLSGHRTTATGNPKTVELTGASYSSLSGGKRRYRCSLNNSLRPGDTADINGESLVVADISYAVGPTMSQMEINE